MSSWFSQFKARAQLQLAIVLRLVTWRAQAAKSK
jgi:hypothetical protein